MHVAEHDFPIYQAVQPCLMHQMSTISQLNAQAEWQEGRLTSFSSTTYDSRLLRAPLLLFIAAVSTASPFIKTLLPEISNSGTILTL